jgi:hypothetical protein
MTSVDDTQGFSNISDVSYMSITLREGRCKVESKRHTYSKIQTQAYSKVQTHNEIVRRDRPPGIDKIQDNHSLTNVNVSNLRRNRKRIRISIIPRHILDSINGLRKTANSHHQLD